MEWYEITSFAIGILGALFGASFYFRYTQLVRFFAELGEASTKTAAALSDQALTKPEAIELLKEWMDAYYALLALLPVALINKLLKR